MLNPWLKAMCITEGGLWFQGNTVPHTMNKNKSVAKNSAKTSVQNDRERNSVLPSRRNIFASMIRVIRELPSVKSMGDVYSRGLIKPLQLPAFKGSNN